MIALELLLLGLLVACSAIYSGSEIGFYSVSATQVDIDAKSGSRRASLMRWLLADEAALLITILIGNNLALELATHVGESALGRVFGITDEGVLALVVTLVLTPIVFVFGEALPKDVFRQRPHALTGVSAPIIALSRVVFWPLERALRLLTFTLERIFRLGNAATAPLVGRDAVKAFLSEGQRHGIIGDSAVKLAGNALRLRGIPVSAAMIPWGDVSALVEGSDPDLLFETVRTSRFSRLPVLAARASGTKPAEGTANTGLADVKGYVHQLEVLHGRHDSAQAAIDALANVRPLWTIDASTPVGRALGEFKAGGRRIALVLNGDEIVGLVSVNDLLDLISAEVVR